MSYDSHYAYEQNEEQTSFVWIIFVLFALAVIGVVKTVYNNSYYKTGQKSEIITAEFKIIEISEESSQFRIFVSSEFKSNLTCSHKPNKKVYEKVNLAYRMHEVKTSSGKYKTIPVFDKDINCKNLSGS